MKPVKISRKKNSVQLEFTSSDASHLNEAIQKCVEVIKSTGGHCSNVVRLPNRKQFLLTLNKSPHVYNRAKDQFEQTRLKARIDVVPSQHTLRALKELVMCGGVHVKVRLDSYEEGKND